MKYWLIILLFLTNTAFSQHHMLVAHSGSGGAACDTIITIDTTITATVDTSTLYNIISAWYDMEEISGTSMVDSFGSNNGVINTSVTINQTVTPGKGYTFPTGSGSDVQISDNDAFSFNDDDIFSIAIWVDDVDLTSTEYLFDKEGEYYAFIRSDGDVELRYEHSSGYTGFLTSSNPVSTATPHFIYFEISGTGYGNVDIFVDNTQITSGSNIGTSGGTTSNTANDVYIGLVGGLGWGDFKAGQLVFFTDHLTSQQQTDLYNSGSGISYADLFTTTNDTTITSDTTLINCGGSTPTPDPASTGTFLTSADIYVGATTSNDTISLDSFNNRTLVAGEDTVGIVEDIEGSLIVSTSGTSGNPLVIGAYGSGTLPKIYGSEIVTGTWLSHSGNIYKIPHSGSVNQVFIDGTAMTSARYPNSGYYDITSAGVSSFTSTQIDGSIDYTGAVACVRTEVWYIATYTVSSSSSQTITLPSEPLYGLDNGEGFFLFNKLDFLDAAGEWYHSGDTLYVWTSDGSSPSDNTVRASVTDNIIDVSGQSYVTVQNLELLHANQYGVYANNSDYITLDSLTIDYADQTAIEIDNGGSSNCTVQECTISNSSYYGYRSRGNDHLVTDNTFRNIGLMSKIGVSGTDGQSQTAIYFRYGGTGNNTATYNNIHNVGYNGIWFWDSPSTTVEYNYIDSACLVIDDGAGIYCYESATAGEDSDNSVIKHNIVNYVIGNTDGFTHTDNRGCGLYTDDRISYVTVDSNTVSTIGQYGLYLHNNKYCEYRYNTVFDAGAGQRTTSAYSATGNHVKHNIFINTASAPDYSGIQPFLGMGDPDDDAIVAIDSNAYYDFHLTEPFRETNTYTTRTFTEWKSDISDDTNSTFDGTLPAGHTERLYYNASKQAVTYYLNGATANELDGTSISSSFTLQPYTSKIITGTNLNLIAQ